MLQKEQNSTNLLLWPPIFRNKRAITPRWINSYETNFEFPPLQTSLVAWKSFIKPHLLQLGMVQSKFGILFFKNQIGPDWIGQMIFFKKVLCHNCLLKKPSIVAWKSFIKPHLMVAMFDLFGTEMESCLSFELKKVARQKPHTLR